MFCFRFVDYLQSYTKQKHVLWLLKMLENFDLYHISPVFSICHQVHAIEDIRTAFYK